MASRTIIGSSVRPWALIRPGIKEGQRGKTHSAYHTPLNVGYIRRSKSLEALLPWLYLKGISTGDVSEALQALLGPEAPGLSPATIGRRKQGWHEELIQW